MFEMSKDYSSATHVAGAMVNPDQKILLVKQTMNGEWSLPKGKIEDIDHIAPRAERGVLDHRIAALRREMFEETGLTPRDYVIVDGLGVAVRKSIGRGEDHGVAYYSGTTLRVNVGGMGPETDEEITDLGFFKPLKTIELLNNPVDGAVIDMHMYELMGLTPGVFGSIQEGYDTDAS